MSNYIGGNVLGNAGADCAKQECESQQILRRINEGIDRIQNAASRARTVADRLMGEKPEAVHKDIPRPLRSGLIGNIYDRLDDLDRHLRELEDVVVRIESV